ncbi:MAG: ribonuclease H-like domain-containing protein [Chloroflexia bacterium]|nr:ribonuclease H-like domain-containing protein [Chloroflexia bacterium]
MNDDLQGRDVPGPVIETDRLLYGGDTTPGIVAVELAGPERVRVYRRDGDETVVDDERFEPWLLATRPEPWAALRSQPRIETLAGPHPLRYLVTFPTWPALLDASRAARESGERMFRLRSPVEHYLTRTGRTLFKGMTFDGVRRLQLDIETTGLDPSRPESEVIIVALRCGEHEEVLLLEESEAALLERLTEAIRRFDPDVIEGHNLFNFDLPFLQERARRWGLPLPWGRDGSPVWIDDRTSRFKAGPLTMPYTPAHVHGRHIVDTYQQIQRYDTGGKLSSYGLKNAIDELGLTRPDRSFVPGDQIAMLWRTDRDRLLRYALDDVRDVDILSRLATPTEFYQTQLLPRSYQSVATGGPGEKINDLMLRAYLLYRQAVPHPEAPRDYPGGHAELLATGSFHPVVKCDVESLYPSIMLSEAITSRSDTLGAYLPMLADLTRRRLDAKVRSRDLGRLGNVAEQAMWEGVQGSFKVLINSFYGYLGYRGALFNDYDAATRVTLAGQRIIKQVVDQLNATGAVPIEVDTDGVYFVPPPVVADEIGERRYIDQLSAGLPDGIRLAHDGRYAGMLSLRLKNYALLGHDGTMLLKGSSLRSRRMEPCLRSFLREAARAFLEGRRDDARNAYFDLANRIRERQLSPAEFVQWGMLNDETIAKFPRLRRLVDRAGVGPGTRSGDRIEYYEREDGELAFVREYARDENVAYLLRRLRDVAERFRELFPAAAQFDAFFPAVSTRTNLDAAADQRPAEQLSLFG